MPQEYCVWIFEGSEDGWAPPLKGYIGISLAPSLSLPTTSQPATKHQQLWFMIDIWRIWLVHTWLPSLLWTIASRWQHLLEAVMYMEFVNYSMLTPGAIPVFKASKRIPLLARHQSHDSSPRWWLALCQCLSWSTWRSFLLVPCMARKSSNEGNGDDVNHG